MGNTGSHPSSPPARETVESDPAYDFADDVPVEDETWDEEAVADEPVEEPVDEDERVVPLDADEFRGPDVEPWAGIG